MSIRIVLADDHPIVLQGLQHLFARHRDLDVAACCLDADSAIAAVRTHRPDVVVLDLRMPQRSGLDLLAVLAREAPFARSVVLTAAISQEQVLEALKRGAAGLVLKEAPPEQLIDCVRRVSQGEQCFDSDTVTQALQGAVNREARGDSSASLTPRELEIVRMVAQGLRNKVIGERLVISESTVKVHLHNIYEKLGIEGRLELVLLAQQRGLV
ncbi:MAG TPA: response regulator transcription factor [Vicinamibacterales bacterium]|nr:response regulator transcription factor [Vicinamibacterales bacterium]